MTTDPQQQAIVLLPHNNRGNPSVLVNMRGEQVGALRFFSHRGVGNGEQVPDYTYVLSHEEHARILTNGRPVAKHYFHGVIYEP